VTTACGGSSSTTPPAVDAGLDAPPAPSTFAGFVIDLLQRHTFSHLEAIPYASFSTLSDPDQENSEAFSTLFP
jgi:hypothetical protein